MISEIEKEKIYAEFYGKVYGYIISKIGSRENAEDLASEVFLKVYGNIGTFDESRASLSTWIFTITRNTLTDYYRTRRVFDEVPETYDAGLSIEDDICSEEMLEALTKGLKSLDERERDIIILRFYSGKTLKEIAEGLGISYAYVKVLQSKAFEKLKRYLK